MLTQRTSPALYWWFQRLLGGTSDKQALCLKHFRRQRRVLEVGSSVGNIATSFRNQNCTYVGVDVDEVVVEYARHRFRRASTMRFLCTDLLDLSEDEPFDYILFAGVCHHVDTAQLKQMLSKAGRLLDRGGSVVLVDPVVPARPTWLMRATLKYLEQGQHVRTVGELRRVISATPGMAVADLSLHPVSATPLGWPVVAQFVVARMAHEALGSPGYPADIDARESRGRSA